MSDEVNKVKELGSIKLITKSCSTLEFNFLPGKYHNLSYIIDVDKETRGKIKKHIKTIEPSQSGKLNKRKQAELFKPAIEKVVGLCFQTSFTTVDKGFNFESFDGDLTEYVKEKNNVWFHFQWSAMENSTQIQDIANQILKTVTWLHEEGKSFKGELHPRNVFFNRSSKRGKIVLHFPAQENPFREIEFHQNFSKVQLNSSVKQDMVAVANLIYFVLTSGRNMFVDYEDDKTHMERLKAGQLYDGCTREKTTTSVWNTVALRKLNCICIPPGSCKTNVFTLICKLQKWIYSMAEQWIRFVMTEIFSYNKRPYYAKNFKNFGNHPFFWTIKDTLGFVIKSSNFLSDSRSSKIRVFTQIKLIEDSLYPTVDKESNLFRRFPNLLSYLHERYETELLNEWIVNSYYLIKEIRNKSVHWSDKSILYERRAAEIELKKMQFVFVSPTSHAKELEVFPTKYCLFWMCSFQLLLLELWDKLKCDIK